MGYSVVRKRIYFRLRKDMKLNIWGWKLLPAVCEITWRSISHIASFKRIEKISNPKRRQLSW